MKKLYNEPVAEKLEFTYAEMVVASNCNPDDVYDDSTAAECPTDDSTAMG